MSEPAGPPAAGEDALVVPGSGWLDRWRELDRETVRSLLGREWAVALRSRAWTRLLAWCAFGTALLALLPVLYRTAPDHWRRPTGQEWLLTWGLGAALILLVALTGWTRRRLDRELRTGTLDEILLSGSSPAEILLAKALAAAGLAVLLTLSALPAAVLAAGIGGEGLPTTLRLAAALLLVAYLGLCFGVEAAFRSGGSFLSGVVWVLFLGGALVASVAKLSGWRGRYDAGAFLRDYNPISTALEGGLERWPPAMGLLLGAVVLLTLFNLRLLCVEWSQAGEEGEPARLQGLIGSRPAGAKVFDEGDALAAFEARFGYRVQLSPPFVLGLGAAALLPAAALTLSGWDRAGLLVFALFFWLAAVVAAHNGCAPFARELETARWPELALLPAPDAALARGKLRPGFLGWWPAGTVAAAGLLLSLLERRPADAVVLAWCAASLLLAAPAAGLTGALLALRTPSPREAHWRVALLVTVLPLVLSLGTLAGMELGWAAFLSPPFAALNLGLTGTLSPGAWVGTGLYLLAGAAAAFCLATRLREWTLRES